MGASASISNDIPGDIILFDGVCNLCSGVVRFIIKRDPKQRFKFASLQSSFAQTQLKGNHIKSSLSTIVLIRGEKIYERSDAVLEIVRQLSGIWPLLFVFKIIPKFMRDFLYNFVANNRYRVFGRSESCMVPTQELKQRFLEE